MVGCSVSRASEFESQSLLPQLFLRASVERLLRRRTRSEQSRPKPEVVPNYIPVEAGRSRAGQLCVGLPPRTRTATSPTVPTQGRTRRPTGIALRARPIRGTGGRDTNAPSRRPRPRPSVRSKAAVRPRGAAGASRGTDASGLSLPSSVQACLFDLDGVLTRTAKLHAAAWKQMFDQFLRRRAGTTQAPFRPFDRKVDYDEYVDGKPRYDGVRSFLASRGIVLPEGRPDDPPGWETVSSLGNLKDRMVQRLLRERGVDVFAGSMRYVRAVRRHGIRCAVVSSSAHCREVLAAAGISELFDARVDGVIARRLHLTGKPAPDTYLAAARKLGVEPARAAIFEDALAGVEAGRAGHFALVVGVDRVGQAPALREHGADIVVSDLADLLHHP